MRIIPTFLPFLLFILFTYYYCAFFTFLLFYPFTLLPFPYLVSKSYIQIKVERFFFVDGVE